MSDDIKKAISLWDHSAVERCDYPPLNGSTESEVAIIGGGFTGLSTALHLAERGIDCTVLESETIGYGGSGRNFGLVNPGLWLPPQEVRASLGQEYGDRLLEVLGDAPRYVFSLIDKHAIACEDTRTGTIHAAHSDAGMRELTGRAEEWRRRGAPVELLDREQVADKIGAPAFYGGLLDRRAGTINPMGYVRGLARAASRAGAGIHADTTVKALQRHDNSWTVTTEHGEVRAKSVVLATNAYTDDLWPGLKQSYTPINYFIIATEPLGEEASHILPERQGVWDTGKIMFSIRRDDFGRVIVGSMGKLIGEERGLSRAWANRYMRRLFPNLGPVEWQKGWYGQIALTPDHILKIHRLAPNLYTPIGYNGRGITTGTIFGKAMADLLAGQDERDLPLPISDLKRVQSAPVMSKVYELTFKANQFVKSL